MKELLSFLNDENGQSMVEYGLIIGLVVLVAFGAIAAFGPIVEHFYEVDIPDALPE